MEMFHGIPFPGHLHTQDSLQLALDFPFQESDIVIASYPKSGKRERNPAVREIPAKTSTSFRLLVNSGIC